ncbi:hypothetical protein RRG08_064311 [Elysia crispata]|uniref:Uncharacterized protein n=1 Tax=Elysia crispata TaxID=231223 RepID=A0AAE1E9C7_9GAST|nr:hypothetical protein RRG08_064311 [Elysia crispata]
MVYCLRDVHVVKNVQTQRCWDLEADLRQVCLEEELALGCLEVLAVFLELKISLPKVTDNYLDLEFDVIQKQKNVQNIILDNSCLRLFDL